MNKNFKNTKLTQSINKLFLKVSVIKTINANLKKTELVIKKRISLFEFFI